MAVPFLIELIFCAGVVNSHFSCLTWEIYGNNLSLICRAQNQVEPVSIVDSKGVLKAKCTLNNSSKCETFQVNAKTIADPYKNEVVFMINDYDRKRFINDEWTCSQGNRAWKTIVSTSKGILSDNEMTLSLLYSSRSQSVTLICFSCREPRGHHVEFLKDDKSIDSITYNIVTGQCIHINGECISDICSCFQSGNKFTRVFPFIAVNKTIAFSCRMKFVDNDKSSIFSMLSTFIFNKQAFIYNGTITSILKPAENRKEMNDEKRNVSGGIIHWVGIGVAFAMPFVVTILGIAFYRSFKNKKRKNDETDLTLEFENLMDDKNISGKNYETDLTSEFEILMANKEVSGKSNEKLTEAQCHIKRTSFSLFSEESKHLSAYLNAFKISLPLAKIQQDSVRRSNDINKICSDVLESPEKICVGSVAEGLNISSSDYDMISFANDSNLFNQTNLKPIPEKRHPGYSKLLVKCIDTHNELIKYTHLKEGKRFLQNTLKELIIYSAGIDHCPNGLNMHGPAYNTVLWETHAEALFQHGETKDNRLDVDFVLCIKINEWPLKTSMWKTRSRASNWPTKKMLRNIKNAGYFLAAVGSKESIDSEMQWRVSFNKAEQLIIESFNETQLHCILLLKLMKNYISDIAGKNISSYTMKTVMFWCLEETSDKYWHSSNLLCCFIFCVSKLKSFVENEFLPNFFIRERNQFIMSEFTHDMKNNVLHYLESFLDDPTSEINLLLPPYREHAITYQIRTLNIGCIRNFIIKWLENQIAMACEDQCNLGAYLLMLYDGKPIKCIFERCNKTLKKLKKVEYTQALRKKLQNYMGVLQYILLIEQKEKGEYRKILRTKYSYYMELSATGDLTHNTLRIATCYLHDDVKEDCLSIIQKVTESNGHFYMEAFRDRLKKSISCDIEALKQREHDYYKMYIRIINNIDLRYHDPTITFSEFEKLKESGILLIGYNSLNLALKQCYSDVTFLLAELPVLPKPAALELQIDNGQNHVSFHPFLYALLLQFLWHEKYGSGDKEKESVLAKMKNCVSQLPNEQKCIGLNFMIYCYMLQFDYCSASKYLIQSFKLNPVEHNVAYVYIKYIIQRLLLLEL